MLIKPFIVVSGPTASGKSALGVDIAQKINGAVVNADSLQLFKDLPLLTAQPQTPEMLGVQHYLYGLLEAHIQPTAGIWLDAALLSLNKIWQEGKTPVLVGGTGLYIMALLKGLSQIPPISAQTKARVNALYNRHDDFYAQVIAYDPLIKDFYHPNDHKRLIRALEVFLETNKSVVLHFKEQQENGLDRYAYKIYLKPDRDTLYDRIHKRFNIMINNGAIEQVEAFLKNNHNAKQSPVFNALGAREIAQYIEGIISYDSMTELAIQKTRNYAKRQYTWFNNQIKHHDIIESIGKLNYDNGIIKFTRILES